MVLINTCETEKLGKRLLGENDVQLVLQRLDRLTLEESRMIGTQTLEVVYGLVKNVRSIMDGACLALSCAKHSHFIKMGVC